MPDVPAVAPAADAPATPQDTPAATPAAAPTGGAAGNLDFLRNTPQFQLLRRLIEEDPASLERVLQELGQANPQLLQAIQAHPDQFIRLLQGAPGAGGGTEGAQPQAPPQNTVQITSAEKEAIDRIKALGFPEHEVVQAFFACDKDENLTANFLFENQE